jgi:3-(3-hydroxy-phenyl)propionate hydroxylase
MTSPAGPAGEHSVVIAGGGPTGLMLAAELTLAGVDVVVVERRHTQDMDGSRGGGLYPRTVEVLDQRGVAERFVEAGQRHPALAYAGIMLPVGDFPTRHNFVLALWQSHFEPILADWVVGELGVRVLRDREVVGCSQDDDGVDVLVSDGTTLRARYLVGCDGGRSAVRRAIGIDFAGVDASTSWMIAEAQMDERPAPGIRYAAAGVNALGPASDGVSVRIVLVEPEVGHTDDPSTDDLRTLLTTVYGTDYGLRSVSWLSRFTDMARQATTYRDRRVLLAGDAAHVHGPQGGQGLNTGVQDAVNLGWKLAQVVAGASPDSLLDTYHAERHPVGARVLQNTLAQVALARGDDRHLALRTTMTELLAMDEPRRHVVGMLSGLDIHYPLDDRPAGDVHPLVGRRMPDLELRTTDGPTRVATLLRPARPLLVDLEGSAAFDVAPWAGRVRLISAVHDGPCELPVLGDVTVPAAILIRPDGHVAWTGALTAPELPGTISAWFG